MGHMTTMSTPGYHEYPLSTEHYWNINGDVKTKHQNQMKQKHMMMTSTVKLDIRTHEAQKGHHWKCWKNLFGLPVTPLDEDLAANQLDAAGNNSSNNGSNYGDDDNSQGEDQGSNTGGIDDSEDGRASGRSEDVGCAQSGTSFAAQLLDNLEASERISALDGSWGTGVNLHPLVCFRLYQEVQANFLAVRETVKTGKRVMP